LVVKKQENACPKLGGAVHFLITIDDHLPESKANEANRLGMIVYVRDELKEQKHLQHKTWVRKLSDFPKDLGEFGFPKI
jgi:hypothetical protein